MRRLALWRIVVRGGMAGRTAAVQCSPGGHLSHDRRWVWLFWKDLQRLIARQRGHLLELGPKCRFTGPGAGRFCTQGDGWRPVFRLPIGDHEVLVRFESIQVAQNPVINNVLSWKAQQPVTFSEYQDRAVGDGSVRPSQRATPNAVCSRSSARLQDHNAAARTRPAQVVSPDCKIVLARLGQDRRL